MTLPKDDLAEHCRQWTNDNQLIESHWQAYALTMPASTSPLQVAEMKTAFLTGACAGVMAQMESDRKYVLDHIDKLARQMDKDPGWPKDKWEPA